MPPELLLENAHPTRPFDADALAPLAHHVLDAEAPGWAAVNVILADHDTVLVLNRDYLAHDYHTDVLSFCLSDPGTPLEGEVYIDLDTADERHTEFASSYPDEVRRYMVHGLLHLAGHDDATPEARAAMRVLEDHYLTADGQSPDDGQSPAS